MDLRARRIAGSLVLALILLHWTFGLPEVASWLRDPGGPGVVAVVLAIAWFVADRVWLAAGILWHRFASPAVQRAYRPTWPHMLGAAGVSLGLHLLLLVLLLTMSRNVAPDWGGLARSLLTVAAVTYVVWPAIVLRCRQWRSRMSLP
jgi:hypothetical protein